MSGSETFSLFIENLTTLDCALLDAQRGPIGMSWRVGIEFIGQTNKDGVVFDFSLAKKAAKNIIDSTADHTFIVPIDELNTSGVQLSVMNGFTYKAPPSAFFPVKQVTKSCIASTLENKIFDACIKDTNIGHLKQVVIHLEEQNDPDSHYFHYTHGLKNHFGNCQRLLHGHKSSVKIFINGKQDSLLEKEIANELSDVHVVNSEHVWVDAGDYTTRVSYTSSQGDFYLDMKPERFIKIPYEPTIENMSKYIANWLKDIHSELLVSTVTVKCYEGIDKGSMYVLVAGKHEPVVVSPKTELLKG